MRLRVVNLSNKEVSVDIAADAAVSELKRQVSELMGTPLETLTLIFHAKILKDEQKLTDYPDMQDGAKLVCMTARKKTVAAPPTAAAEPTPAAAVSTATEVGTSEVSSAAAPVTAAASPPVGISDAAASLNSSGLLVGSQLQETIEQIVSMGFPQEQVVRAMRAAFNNPERAVEYLTSGMPVPSEPVPAAAAAAERPPQAGPPEAAFGEGFSPGESEIDSALDQLRAHPHFDQFRAVVQSNPSLLPGLMQLMASSSPELANIFMRHPRESAQALLEALQSGETAPGGAGIPGGGGPGVTTVQVTAAQRAQIQNLEALGFPPAAALQALIVCDWNEDRAANFLFDASAEDEGTATMQEGTD